MSDEPDRLDAPNQQAVRADQSAPWDEGSGGSSPEEPTPEEPRPEPEEPAPEPEPEPDE